MKKVIVAGLVILGVVDLAALAYLHQRQNAAEKRIEEGIRRDLDERRQIEDSIKGAIESKKQAQAFVLQQEYVRQIDDMTQQLNGLSGALDASANRLQEQITYLKQEFGQQLEAYKLQAQESSRKSFAYIKQLEESGIRRQEQLTRLEDAFNRQVQSLTSRLASYASRLREYQRKVDVLSAKAPVVPKEGSGQ